jgi:hypothetical protein
MSALALSLTRPGAPMHDAAHADLGVAPMMKRTTVGAPKPPLADLRAVATFVRQV